MTISHGVDFTIQGSLPTPLPTSETILGIVGEQGTAVAGQTRADNDVPTLVTNLEDAQARFGTGTEMERAFQLIYGALRNIRCVGITTPASPSHAQYVTAVEKFRAAESIVGVKPDLITSGGTSSYSGNNIVTTANTVVTALNTEADLIKSIALAAGPTGMGASPTPFDDVEAWADANNTQQKRTMFTYPDVIRVGGTKQSGAVAVMVAMARADRILGIQRAPSNIEAPGFTSLSPTVAFSYSDSTIEAQTLDTDKKVTTIVNFEGFRLWGGLLVPATGEPSEFQFVGVRRVADFIERRLTVLAQGVVDAGLLPTTEEEIISRANSFLRSLASRVPNPVIREGSVASLGINYDTATLQLGISITPVLPARRISWVLSVSRS